MDATLTSGFFLDGHNLLLIFFASWDMLMNCNSGTLVLASRSIYWHELRMQIMQLGQKSIDDSASDDVPSVVSIFVLDACAMCDAGTSRSCTVQTRPSC